MTNFYQGATDPNASSGGVNAKSVIVESNQIEKNIRLLTKKLQAYEKRKEKAIKHQLEQKDR